MKKTKPFRNRLISVLVCAVMLIAVVAVPASADGSAYVPTNLLDFSEANLVATALHESSPVRFTSDHGVDSGGNTYMAVATLAGRHGAVAETDQPYPVNATPGDISYVAGKANAAQLKTAIDIYPSSVAELKAAIQQYGVASVSYLHNWDCYNDTTGAYFYPTAVSPVGAGTSAEGGHAVTCVGWDDSYSKDNFSNYKPRNNGAFIIKNSWGEGAGDGGFTYISYEDKYMLTRGPATFFYATPTSEDYGKMYSYDTYGPYFGGSTYYTTSNTAMFGNSFTVGSQDETLKAVSTYVMYPNASFKVYVVTNFNGSSLAGAQLVSESAVYNCGYYTIDLAQDNWVKLDKNTQYAVMIEFTLTGTLPEYQDGIGNFQFIPTEWKDSDVGTTVSGKGIFKTDTGFSLASNGNICVKAFSDIGWTGSSSGAKNTVNFSEIVDSFAVGESDTEPVTPGTSDILPTVGDSDNVAVVPGGSAKLLNGTEPAVGSSDEAVPGQSDDVVPGSSDDIAPGESDDVAPGSSDEAVPGVSDEKDAPTDKIGGNAYIATREISQEWLEYDELLSSLPDTGAIEEYTYKFGYVPLKYAITRPASSSLPSTGGILPAKFDWRTEDYRVTSVKNQYSVGSCWTFSAMASMEANMAFNLVGDVDHNRKFDTIDIDQYFRYLLGLDPMPTDDIKAYKLFTSTNTITIGDLLGVRLMENKLLVPKTV